MAKQKYIIRDFSGGMNTKRDPRDLAENESSLLINMSVDAIGKLKTAGGFYPHIRSFNTLGNMTVYIPDASVNLKHTTPISGGGYGAFYFESDYNLSNLVITETKSGTPLVIGTSNGNISFEKVDSKPDGTAYVPSYDPE